MSDTPRTDAAMDALGDVPIDSVLGADAAWVLAAQLERECAQLREQDRIMRLLVADVVTLTRFAIESAEDSGITLTNAGMIRPDGTQHSLKDAFARLDNLINGEGPTAH